MGNRVLCGGSLAIVNALKGQAMKTNEFDTHDGKYTITSYGNGWAYGVRCNTEGAYEDALWFQDHDAEQLQADTNNFENTDVIGQYFECLEG